MSPIREIPSVILEDDNNHNFEQGGNKRRVLKKRKNSSKKEINFDKVNEEANIELGLNDLT